MATEYQLRQYVVAKGKWDEFISIFPRIAEVRKAAGFGVVGVWTVPEENRFIWIVSTDHPEGIEGASHAYYDLPGRKAINLDPDEVFTEILTTTMTALPGF